MTGRHQIIMRTEPNTDFKDIFNRMSSRLEKVNISRDIIMSKRYFLVRNIIQRETFQVFHQLYYKKYIFFP